MDADSANWSTRIRLFGGLSLGLGLMGWFLYSLHWAELFEVLKTVSWFWLAVAVWLMLLDYLVQAVRWGYLLEHVDDEIPVATLWTGMSVQWAFNTLLPLRAGNFLRPAIVARARGLPFTVLLFTAVGEYVCDAFAVVLMVLLTVFLLPDGLMTPERLAEVQLYGGIAAVATLVALVVVVLLGTHRARHLVEALFQPIPVDWLRERLMVGFDQLVAGMAAVGNPFLLGKAMAATVVVWTLYYLAILATFRAFGLDLPYAASLFMEAALTLAMLVPQAPGFLGVFQVVTEESLSLFGAPVAMAEGIALLFWVVCFVPVTIWGVFDASRHGVGLRGRGSVYEDLGNR